MGVTFAHFMAAKTFHETNSEVDEYNFKLYLERRKALQDKHSDVLKEYELLGKLISEINSRRNGKTFAEVNAQPTKVAYDPNWPWQQRIHYVLQSEARWFTSTEIVDRIADLEKRDRETVRKRVSTYLSVPKLRGQTIKHRNNPDTRRIEYAHSDNETLFKNALPVKP
jgi:hypothetical protein